MNQGFDWEAPIEPGRAMLGLPLGLSHDAIKKLIGCDGETLQRIVKFHNSPRLLIDCREPGVIFFRAADMENVVYDWQNILARLVFKKNVLESIVVESVVGGAGYEYKGKIFTRVGLGAKVMDLLEFGSLEYDDADEVFYSDGLEIAGNDSCDLSVNPNQVVVYIKIF
ncbi:hypothetical protein [Burkholderia sp. MSMB1078WGS]|uniref:hypothetical protein n=1 Tax=Burkholderia sp. MSMB1078WGS TaxID=1637900 RepID=UPI0012E351D2|nr:hypothetical protein [Burkholderia sp. MSMB1078WGS]